MERVSAHSYQGLPTDDGVNRYSYYFSKISRRIEQKFDGGKIDRSDKSMSPDY